MSAEENKIAKLQSLLAGARLDLALIGPTAHMRYLLGGTPHADERLTLLLVSPESACLIVPEINVTALSPFTSLPFYTWADAEGPEKAVQAAMASFNACKSAGIDGGMRADFLLPFLRSAGLRNVVSLEPIMARLRVRKSPAEIALLQQAAAQADRAMRAGMAACRPGASEAEVALAIEEYFRKDGAEAVEFCLVAAGENGALPHHHPGERRLKRGDAVVIDIGASLHGYNSDITRMCFMGNPSEEQMAVFKAVLAANERARGAVKPGVTAGSIDDLARGSLRDAGLAEHFTHRTGHGLGLDIHEAPYIMAGSPELLEEGMAFSIEPGVYLPGKFGVRIEDIVVVTASGSQTLTGFAHEPVIID